MVKYTVCLMQCKSFKETYLFDTYTLQVALISPSKLLLHEDFILFTVYYIPFLLNDQAKGITQANIFIIHSYYSLSQLLSYCIVLPFHVQYNRVFDFLWKMNECDWSNFRSEPYIYASYYNFAFRKYQRYSLFMRIMKNV